MWNYKTIIFFFYLIAFDASTSALDVNNVSPRNIKQNFALEIKWKLEDIPKILRIHNKNYYLRGLVTFSKPERSCLRISHGHYKAFLYRSNDRWEIYDDLMDKVIIGNKSKTINVELLMYTL